MSLPPEPYTWVGSPIPRKEYDMTGLKDAAKSALLVWLFTTIGLWIPGLFGWVHDVSSWAEQKGAPPFPDPSNLGFLFVAALTAAFPAAVAGLVRFVENGFDIKLLPRTAAAPVGGRRGEGGQGYIGLAVGVLLVIILVVVLFRLL
jgi:hypothetical protein